jgi:translation elongation factor EF-1alpha
MDKELIGKITHVFDKIGVAVIELEKGLKVGEKISIEKDGEAFEQVVDSMQIERTPIQAGKAGDAIGLKTIQPAKKGSDVYKVLE